MLNISRQTGTGSGGGGSVCIHVNLICLLTSRLPGMKLPSSWPICTEIHYMQGVLGCN